MTGQLPGFLAKVGRGLGRNAEWGWLRFVALCVGSAALALAALFSTLTLGLGNDREHTMRSLLPVVAEDGQSAALLYSYHLPFLRDRDDILQPAVAIWISPLTDDAPLPPGVSAWPDPGEAVVSPAARQDLRAYPAHFFGRVVGSIAPEGLEVPGERRIYVRPTAAALDHDEMTPISGFGGDFGSDGFWGPPTLYARPLWALLSAIGLLLIAPAAIAIAIGARIGAETRHRRSRQLYAMGAGRSHLAIVDIAEAWIPLALGSLIGLGALLGLGLFDINLRFLNSISLASNIRELWWASLAAILVADVLAVVIVLCVRLRQRAPRVHEVKALQRVPHRRALVCVVAALLAVWLPVVFGSSDLRIPLYVSSVLIVVLTLPALASVLLLALGQVAVTWGRKTGSPGSILAGRRLVAFPARTARLMSGVAAAILIFGQVQLFASTLGQLYLQGLADRAAFGGVVLTGHFHDSTGVKMFLGDLPPGVEPVWTWSRASEGTPSTQFADNQVFLTGSCAALRALEIPCDGSEIRDAESANKVLTALSVGAGLSNESTTVIPDDAPDLHELTRIEAQISLISTTGRDMPVDELRRLANQSVVGGMDLESIGERAIAGVTAALYGQRWIVMWGLLGLLPLMVATATLLGADALIAARATAPLAALSDRYQWLAVVSLGGIWLPLTLAGSLASLGYLVLPTSMTASSGSVSFFTPSFTYAWMSALLCTLLGLVLSYWNRRATVRAAETWRP